MAKLGHIAELDKKCIHVYTINMTSIQYTIRNIPPEVDKTLKKRARITGKSFNQVVVDELSKNVDKTNGKFDWLINTMDSAEGKKFDEALADLNRPDPDFWR